MDYVSFVWVLSEVAGLQISTCVQSWVICLINKATNSAFAPHEWNGPKICCRVVRITENLFKSSSFPFPPPPVSLEDLRASCLKTTLQSLFGWWSFLPVTEISTLSLKLFLMPVQWYSGWSPVEKLYLCVLVCECAFSSGLEIHTTVVPN